ncbi:hypothetical protein BASA60_008309 [Batrachochytrium salamandrivorans]|nr:hypothetical protein BASA60_008309 [Batrachochytrium salamandrivorans]
MPLIFNGLVAVTNQLLSTHGRDSGQTDNTVPLLSSNGNEYEDPGPSNQVPPQHRDLVVRLLDTIKGVWSRMKNGTMQRFNKNGHSTTGQENNLATGQENNLATGEGNNLATDPDTSDSSIS